MTNDEIAKIFYSWDAWERPNQLPPEGRWRVWLLLAGRGFGKTRSGAEYMSARVRPRTANRLALVAPTAADARDVMVEGASGILAIIAFEPAALRAVEATIDLAERCYRHAPQRGRARAAARAAA